MQKQNTGTHGEAESPCTYNVAASAKSRFLSGFVFDGGFTFLSVCAWLAKGVTTNIITDNGILSSDNLMCKPCSLCSPNILCGLLCP